MAQAGFTPIQLYRTTTASAQPSAGNLAAGELAINLTDKKLYAKDASNNVFLLADASSGGTTAANLAGGAAGSLPYQTGANATTFLGIGAANRVLTSSGSAPQWVTSLTGLTGVSSSSVTNTSLTPTRLVYSTTGGAQTDSANLTFDGTSLTLGGNPTLSAGTANGVLYLNASKVATSGSALTFDGTALATTGSAYFSTALSYLLNAGGGAGFQLRGLGSGVEGIAFTNLGASSEYMRLTSTGLGIGTSSPAYKLDVRGLITGGNGTIIGGISYSTRPEIGALSNHPCGFITNNTTQMLLDTSGNLGIGTSSPDYQLVVSKASDTYIKVANTSASITAFYGAGSTGAYVGTGTNHPIQFIQNSSEQMRLDSTGLGIGTSSPITKLSNTSTTWSGGIATDGLVWRSTQNDWTAAVLGTPATGAGYGLRVHTLGTTSSDYPFWISSGAGAGSVLAAMTGAGNLGIGTSSPTFIASGAETGVSIKASSTNAAGVNVSSSNAQNTLMEMFASYTINQGGFYLKGDSAYPQMVFGQVNGATYRDSMLLDSSGNLGLGVTPNIWSSGLPPVFQTAYGNINGAGNTQININQNAYLAGAGWTYLTNGAATMSRQEAGAFVWFNAPSGTAGNAISFTQAMTLDASGNLGIGTNSPAAKLDVADSSFFPSIAFKRIGTGIWYVGGDNAGGTSNFRIALNTSQFVTIDTSGNLGLGVTPSASWSSGCRVFQFGIYSAVNENFGGYPEISFNSTQTGSTSFVYRVGTNPATRFSQTNGAFQWFTAPSGTAGNAISFSQVMTLDASGRFLVGTTTAGIGGSANTIFTAKGNADTYASIIASGNEELLLAAQSGITKVGAFSNHPLLLITNNSESARIPAAGGMVVGTAALATTATDGFLYVPTCAGTPTGTPTTQTGTAPIVVDTTNNKLYFYSGGQWRDAGP